MAATFCFLSGVAEAAGENVLRIGVDASYPPYTFYDENKVLSGLDPTLAREACRRLGITALFVPIKWDRKADYFADKRIDCVWSCFSMTGRESEYRWIPYLYSRQVVVVRTRSSVQRLTWIFHRAVEVRKIAPISRGGWRFFRAIEQRR